MKISVENKKICHQTTMGERLERLGEVWIVEETDCFGLDVNEEMERMFRSTPQIWQQYSREGRI